MDWSDANARIQDNAIALQAAIEYINARKHADGSSEPNVMIGASMGGLVGKFCLLHMHNVQGKDAEVERFFTYDSPLKGANFPVGIQLLVRDLLNISSSAASDPNVQLALQLLDGYAATQMLRQKAIIDANGNLALSSAGFDALQVEMDALSAIKPLTGITRHIALSNGAGNGTKQESVTYAQAMSFSLTLDGVPAGGYTPYWQYDVLIQGTAYTARETTTLLYERTTKVIPIFIFPINIEESVSYTHPTALKLDVAPGGNSNIGLAQLKGALNAAFENVPDQIGYHISMHIDHFCFDPTVSSLGLPVTTDLFTPTSGGAASRSSVSLDNSVVSNYSQLPEFNQEHVTMNVRIADVLVDELMPHPTTDVLGQALSTGQIYNFGKAFDTSTPGGILSTPREIDQDLTIQNGGQLWINRKDRIAYTANVNNPPNISPQAFFVSVPGEICGGSQKVVVTIEDGGKLVIGDNEDAPENSGGLYFTSTSELYAFGSNPILLEDKAELTFDIGSRVELKAGAELRAKDHGYVSATQSTFIMESDTKVTFESLGDFRLDNTSVDVPLGSEIALLNGSELTVSGQTSVFRLRAGAILRIFGEGIATFGLGTTLILDPGANIILESPESQIRIEGKLIYNGDFNFSGLGYFNFDLSHTLEFGPNATHFRLNGPIPFHRTMRLNNGAILLLPDGIDLLMNKGGVEYAGGSSIQLGRGNVVDCRFVRFYSYDTGGAPCLLGAAKPGDISIDHCKFEDVERAMQIVGGLGSNPFNIENNVSISNSSFTGYGLGSDISQRQGVSLSNCTFAGGLGAYALSSDRNFFTILRNCQISGHSSTGQVSNFNANDVLTDPNMLQGVLVNGGFIFWMDGGSINNCDIGIGNRAAGLDPFSGIQHVPANVILTNQATLENCLSGISMEGNATQGLVLASCARFRWNIYGISGSDITLMIDPTLMSPSPSITLKTNSFLRDVIGPAAAQNKHLSICYALKNPGGSIPATKNFWGKPDYMGGIIPETDPTSAFNVRMSPSPGIACGNTHPLIPVAWSPAATAEPRACDTEENCESSVVACWTDCLLPTDEESTVRNQFQEGLEYLLAEQPGEAYDAIHPVSELWQSDMPTGYTDVCRSFIQAARSLVEGEGFGEARFDHKSSLAGDIKIQPNPASGKVVVWLPAGQCRVRVFDLAGRLSHESQAEQTCLLDTSTWKPGLYIVEVTLENEVTTSRAKLLVQR